MKDCRYRAVQDAFWTDIVVIEMEPDEKLVYLWLITNRHLDICGCYQVSHRTVEYETGIPWVRGREIFRKFEQLGRMLYSEENKEILLCKWKNNNEGFFKAENKKSVSSIRTGIERIKTLEFRDIILNWLGDEQAPIVAPSVAPSLEGNAQPEPEPEPELKPKDKSMEHVEICDADPAGQTTAGGQADDLPVAVPLVERQIRAAIAEKRLLIAEKYPEVDIEVETLEMVAKYRGQSLGVDPWVLISRWLKNLKAAGRERASPGHGMTAEAIDAENREVARRFCGVEA